MGVSQVTLLTSWETYMQVKRQQLEPYMKQWTGSKLGKEYIKAICCHCAYFTYMQSTSCKMLVWMKHKLKSRLPGEITITSDMQMIPLLWKKAKRNKEPSDEAKRGEWKSWCIKFMASGPITMWQTEGGKVETVTDFIFLGFRITVDNDCSSLARKLWPT